MEIKKGQIYYADLSPVVGSEQGGYRPILIIQNDIGNKYSPTIIAAPITSKVNEKHNIPTHKEVHCAELPKNSMALLEQIRTLDKCRLKQYVGKITPHNLQQVDIGLKISLGITD